MNTMKILFVEDAIGEQQLIFDRGSRVISIKHT